MLLARMWTNATSSFCRWGYTASTLSFLSCTTAVASAKAACVCSSKVLQRSCNHSHQNCSQDWETAPHVLNKCICIFSCPYFARCSKYALICIFIKAGCKIYNACYYVHLKKSRLAVCTRNFCWGSKRQHPRDFLMVFFASLQVRMSVFHYSNVNKAELHTVWGALVFLVVVVR